MLGSALCAYPWDIIGDDAAADRFAGIGVDRVLLAAAYHGVRASTPQHPDHRLVIAERSALYMPARAESWQGRRFMPRPAGSWAEGDAFGESRDALVSAGARVGAWVVLTHDDDGLLQGSSAVDVASDARVLNAFGDVFPHALCPASHDVVTYTAGLVEEVAARGVSEIMLEAAGQLGLEHLGAHDKIVGADWSATDSALLSLCFCTACRLGLDARGVDTDRVAAAVRSSVGEGFGAVSEAIGEDSAGAVLTHRHAAAATLLRTASDAARRGGVTRISVHVGLDPWATSSFSSFPAGPLPVDAVVLSENTAKGLPREDVVALQQETDAQISAYVSAMPPASPNDLPGQWRTLVERGIDDLIIYHGGLLSAPRLSAIELTLRGLKNG